MLLAKFRANPLKEEVVHIGTSQVLVPVGGQHIGMAAGILQQRRVKGATAKIQHGHQPVSLFLGDAVGEASRGWFVDELKEFAASKFRPSASRFGVLFREIRWDGHYHLAGGTVLTEDIGWPTRGNTAESAPGTILV